MQLQVQGQLYWAKVGKELIVSLTSHYVVSTPKHPLAETVLMRRSRTFSIGGPTLTFFCSVLVDEGRRKDPNTTTISGPSCAHQQNAI